MLSCFSHVWLFATLWTITHQAPLSMGFSRQEYWSALPCSPPGDLPDSGIEPASLRSTCIGRRVLYLSATWEALVLCYRSITTEIIDTCCHPPLKIFSGLESHAHWWSKPSYCSPLILNKLESWPPKSITSNSDKFSTYFKLSFISWFPCESATNKNSELYCGQGEPTGKHLEYVSYYESNNVHFSSKIKNSGKSLSENDLRCSFHVRRNTGFILPDEWCPDKGHLQPWGPPRPWPRSFSSPQAPALLESVATRKREGSRTVLASTVGTSHMEWFKFKRLKFTKMSSSAPLSP